MKTKMNKNNPNKCSGEGCNFSCRHPKLWSYIKSNVKAFFITGAVVFTISASATTVKILHSRQVRYKNDKSVEQAINELYEKASRIPKSYKIGDEIKVNNMDFYVISESPRNQDYVVALKKDPLTVAEVQTYGVGHINNYTWTETNVVYDYNGYGGIAFYSSPTCGAYNNNNITSGCKNENATNYDNSDIKHVIDNWQNSFFVDNELKEVDGYKTRLIKLLELEKLGYVDKGSWYNYEGGNLARWSYNSNYSYWTMTPYGNSANGIIEVRQSILRSGVVHGYVVGHRWHNVVRPVINVYKSAIQKTN